MSQQPIGAPQEFDIDSIEVEILIICKNPAAFQQSASFLSRRGWPTTVVGNLSKAIDHIVKHQPDFVMISLNHPNPNTMRLPPLLTAGMNTEVIAFAELGDAGTAAKLANSNVKNKLQGLPSGPNVQRAIRRMLMEALGKNEEETPTLLTDPDPTPTIKKPARLAGTIEKHIADPENGNEDVIEGGTYKIGRQKQRKRLKDLLNEKQPAETVAEAARPDKKALLELVDERAAKGESGMMFMPSKAEGLPENDKTMAFVPQPRESTAEGDIAYMPEHKAGKDHLAKQAGHGSGEMHSALQKGTGPGELHSALQQGNAGEMHSALQKATGAGNEFGARTGGRDPETGRPRAFGVKKPSRGSKKYQSLFEKSVEEALARTCVSNGGTVRDLEDINVVAALPVEGSDLHGYLVISISRAPGELQLEVLRSFRGELSTLLAEAGVPVTTDEPFSISMESFEFLEWVKDEAALAFITDHMGAQVCVSLIETEHRLPQPRDSEKRDMAKISVKELETETASPFKAYLHFKRSDRFYLYLRNGRKLYKKQKDRLLTHKIDDFYIKSVDINNFKIFTASNFIAGSTLKFRRKKAA
jgi:CheY-like chemotaxis protein